MIGNFRLVAILLLCVLFAQEALSAKISGSVFGPDLDSLNDAIVDVNSVPLQRIVSKNGGYSFELSPGTYQLKAELYENKRLKYSTKETIAIPGEGSFVYDLILLPNLEDDIADFDIAEGIDPGIDETTFSNGNGTQQSDPLLGLVIVAILLGAVYFVFFRAKPAPHAHHPPKKDFDEEAEPEEKAPAEPPPKPAEKLDKYALEVLDALHKSGNRLTQKELREKLPHSEAKVSLIITELESLGKIKKIKKGRGNIIVLKEA